MEKARQHFTKLDAVTLFLLILLGILISFRIYLPDKSPGSFLEIQQNGKVIKTLPLDEDHRESIPSENGGWNTFSIQNGEVSMTEANCGDHSCIRTGSISKSGESIICLPHRLVFRIIAHGDSGHGNGTDAIAY